MHTKYEYNANTKDIKYEYTVNTKDIKDVWRVDDRMRRNYSKLTADIRAMERISRCAKKSVLHTEPPCDAPIAKNNPPVTAGDHSRNLLKRHS